MASQHSIADPGVSRSILAVDGETDSETRRLHARTRGSVNALTVEIVDASGAQVTSFGGAGGGDGAILDGVSSSIKATVRDYTNSNPLAVSLTDATGDAIATLPISAASLPLPSGAATAANQQTDALTDTQLRATAVPVSGTFWQATQPISGTVTANLGTIADVATQTTLALIKAKTDNIPAQGQALAAASVPVVLTAAQETALTPPAAITGFATSAKQDTIIGHVDGIETVLGTIDTDTGNIATSVTDIPNVIGTDGAAGPSKTLSVAGTQATGEIEELRTDVDGHLQIDVLTAPTTTVQATNLDIRDLVAASDAVTVHGDVGVIDQLDLTNSNPAVVAIVDVNGDQITSFGGGTQYSDADVNADPTGTVAMGTDGSNVYALHTDAAGDLQVDVLTSALPTGASELAEQQSQTTHLATIAGDTTAIQTAVELIDDTVATLGTTTYTETSTKGLIIGAVRRDADTTLVGTTNEIGPLQMDANGRLKVEIFDGGDSHTVDGTVTANLSATDNAVLDNIDADTSAIQTAVELIDDAIKTDDAAFTPATTKVMMAGFEADETTTDSVDEGDAGAARMTLDRKQIVTVQPHTAGGLTPFYSLDLDESEEAVKASAGQLYGWKITNRATSARYVKFYNATTANVTVGTTTPLFTLAIPGGASDNIMSDIGIAFSTAITVAATTGFADNDTGAPAANDVLLTLFYN